MQFHSFMEFESSLFSLVTLSRKVCFSPRKMALLHRHRRRSPFLLFFLVSSLPTSVTTCLDRCFHQKLFPKPSYFFHISSGGQRVPLMIYHQGDPLSPTIFNMVVDNVGKTVGMLCRFCRVVKTFWCQMRNPGPMLGRQPVGGGGGGG